MKERIFAIGDIHGDFNALKSLVTNLNLQKNDTLVFLGDVIDKGPASKEVLEYLCELDKKYSCIFIKGNHEDALIRILNNPQDSHEREQFWRRHGGQQTLESYGVKSIAGLHQVMPDHHKNLLAQMRDLYETKTHVFVHAGYNPDAPSDEQCARTLRIQFMMAAKAHNDFEKEVICGHSSLVSGRPARKGHLLCIDTGEYGWLTAYAVHSKTFVQACVGTGTIRKIDKACDFSIKKHVPKRFWPR